MTNNNTMQFKLAWNLTGEKDTAVYFDTPVIPFGRIEALGQKIRIVADKITAGWEKHWQETYQGLKDDPEYKNWDTTIPRALVVIINVNDDELIRTQDNTLPNQFPQCFHELCYRLAEGLEAMKYELSPEERDVVENGGILERENGVTMMSTETGDKISSEVDGNE